MSNVIISTAAVPAGFCPSAIQTDWPFLISLLSAQLQGTLNTFNYGNTTPAAIDRDKPWFRLNADGTPDRIYFYLGGNWVARNPIPPGPGGAISLYDGTLVSIDTYDGGETGVPVGPATGPMWEKVSAFDAKFLIGPGTLPGGTVLAVGATGGEETHVLSDTETPNHDHDIKAIRNPRVQVIGSAENVLHSIDPQDGAALGSTQVAETLTTEDWRAVADTLGHNNLPPYVAWYAIRRTARIFYRI